MKHFIIFLLVSIVTINCVAQETINTSKHRTPRTVLKWSPLDLFAFFPSVQLSLEQQVVKDYSVQLTAGPIINSPGTYSSTDMEMRGYKAKIQVRKYFLGASPFWKYFVGPELGRNRANYLEGNTYLVKLPSLLDYYEYRELRRNYKETNVMLTGGAFFSTYRFCIEFQAGLGVRFIDFNPTPILPENYEPISANKDRLFSNTNSRNVINPSAAVLVGFILH